MYRQLVLLFLLFFYLGLTAQKRNLVFDHYGLNEGFLSREAFDITTTNEGLIWVSSNDGLARFDSNNFKFYRNNPKDSNSISTNECNTLETDKRGWIWVSCKNSIDVFNPSTNKFSHIKMEETLPSGKLQKPFEYSFCYDRSTDIMWIGGRRGLYYSKAGALHLQSIRSISNDTLLQTQKINVIIKGDEDLLWVCTGLKIIQLHTKTGKTAVIEIPKKINAFVNDEAITYISCAYLDAEHTLWIGTIRNGLIAYHTKTNIFEQFNFPQTTNTSNRINSIIQEKENEDFLYISNSAFGLYSFNKKNKTFESYSTQFTHDLNGINGKTYRMFLDYKTGIWIGSETGLHKLDFKKQIFQKLDISSVCSPDKSAAVTRMVVEKANDHTDKTIWFYIPDNGCYRYNLLDNKVVTVPEQLKKYFFQFDFYDFFIDSKNILWINNLRYGLVAYDILANKIIVSENNYFLKQNVFISQFLEDKNSNIWMGTHAGIFMWDRLTSQITPIDAINNTLSQKGLSIYIESLTLDEAGVIWFVADVSEKANACIGKYDMRSQKCTIAYDETKDKKIHEFGPLVSLGNKIYVNDGYKEIVWVSKNQPNALVHKITNENNDIGVFVKDAYNNLWCSSNFGLSVYDNRDSIFTNYMYTDYPIGSKNKPRLALSAASGILYIGQTDAINYLDTKQPFNTKNSSTLIFTDINVYNEPYKIGDRKVVAGDVLHLDYTQNMLSIRFALLSYTNASENIYKWKLEGVDKDWNISKNNEATYTNLSPGKYTLLVKAANCYGNWTAIPIKLIIIINPPFYKTWWFILLAIIFFSVSIYYIVKKRLQQLREKYSLQNKIASDLHDEVGSTLTSINILSNISQQAMEKQPEQAREMLQKISSQSKTIQQNISDIVWSIRPDNEKGESLLTRMREYASQTLEPSNIAFDMHTDESITEKIMPMAMRKELLLIYKEAISNIIKHSGANSVKVSFIKNHKHFILTITDNGTWKGNNSGTGTKTMQERAEVLGGSLSINHSANGTTVVASIPIP